MKKLLLTLSLALLVLFAAAVARAEGTISFANGATTRVQFLDLLGGPATAAFPFNVTVYYAETVGEWQGPALPLGRSVGDTGLFTGPGILQLPGTDGGQLVSLQLFAWDATYGDDPYQAWLAGAGTAATDVRQVTLGPPTGPGTVIWQGVGGNDSSRFTPLTFWNAGIGGPAPPVVPEPSTLALGALGGLMLLLRMKKSLNK